MSVNSTGLDCLDHRRIRLLTMAGVGVVTTDYFIDRSMLRRRSFHASIAQVELKIARYLPSDVTFAFQYPLSQLGNNHSESRSDRKQTLSANHVTIRHGRSQGERMT